MKESVYQEFSSVFTEYHRRRTTYWAKLVNELRNFEAKLNKAIGNFDNNYMVEGEQDETTDVIQLGYEDASGNFIEDSEPKNWLKEEDSQSISFVLKLRIASKHSSNLIETVGYKINARLEDGSTVYKVDGAEVSVPLALPIDTYAAISQALLNSAKMKYEVKFKL